MKISDRLNEEKNEIEEVTIIFGLFDNGSETENVVLVKFKRQSAKIQQVRINHRSRRECSRTFGGRPTGQFGAANGTYAEAKRAATQGRSRRSAKKS